MIYCEVQTGESEPNRDLSVFVLICQIQMGGSLDNTNMFRQVYEEETAIGGIRVLNVGTFLTCTFDSQIKDSFAKNDFLHKSNM